jgi:hypothetical protein
MKIRKFNENVGGDTLTNYVEQVAEKTFSDGGNGQNLLDSATELAGFIDTYALSGKTPSPFEGGFYTENTFMKFKELIDSMYDDEIEHNQFKG